MVIVVVVVVVQVEIRLLHFIRLCQGTWASFLWTRRRRFPHHHSYRPHWWLTSRLLRSHQQFQRSPWIRSVEAIRFRLYRRVRMQFQFAVSRGGSRGKWSHLPTRSNRCLRCHSYRWPSWFYPLLSPQHRQAWVLSSQLRVLHGSTYHLHSYLITRMISSIRSFLLLTLSSSRWMSMLLPAISFLNGRSSYYSAIELGSACLPTSNFDSSTAKRTEWLPQQKVASQDLISTFNLSSPMPKIK